MSNYSENHTVNDIVLMTINDGDGTMCGMAYPARVAAGRAGCAGLLAFRKAAKECGRYRLRHFANPLPARAEWVEAGNILMRYYEEHAKECDEVIS